MKYKYTRIKFDALAIHFEWQCKERIKTHFPEESWYFWVYRGIRRPGWNRVGNLKLEGEYLFNPCFHIRVLGLWIGVAFSLCNWPIVEAA